MKVESMKPISYESDNWGAREKRGFSRVVRTRTQTPWYYTTSSYILIAYSRSTNTRACTSHIRRTRVNESNWSY